MTRTWERMKQRKGATKERGDHLVLGEKCGRSFLLEGFHQQYLRPTMKISSFILLLVVHTKTYILLPSGLEPALLHSVPAGCIGGWRWVPPAPCLFPVRGSLLGTASTTWGGCGHRQPRTVNHVGTGAQGGLCAGATASRGSRSGGVPGQFSEEPFRSGKEAEMAARCVTQRGHSYLCSVLSPSSGAVICSTIFIILLLSSGWTFFKKKNSSFLRQDKNIDYLRSLYLKALFSLLFSLLVLWILQALIISLGFLTTVVHGTNGFIELSKILSTSFSLNRCT